MKKHSWNFQTAFITGASKGLGRWLAMELAKKNIPKMIITGRNPEKLSSLASYLRHFVSEVLFFSADLSLKQERQKILSAISEHKPDLFINNAGFGLYGSIFNASREKHVNVAKVNALAPFEFTLEVIHSLEKEKRKGVIVNISSIASFFSVPAMGAYSATKAFINNFSESLDHECKEKGIRILTSCLGAINTDFSTTAANQNKVSQPMQMLKEDVVKKILWQIEHRKQRVIFDSRYRIGYYLLKLMPKKFSMKLFRQSCLKRVQI